MTTSEYCAPLARLEGRLNIFDNGPGAMQPVFRDYDQKALDDAYDQAVYAPNRDQLLERRNLASEAARGRMGEPQRFAYGAGSNEQLDVYASRTGTHVQVFVHGGAWRAGRAREYAAPAEMFVGAGAHYVALEGAGKAVELVLAQGYNHFEVAETLGNPYGPMGRAVLAQMGLSVHPESARPEPIRPGAPGAPGAPSPT